jgi:hypothetical protein
MTTESVIKLLTELGGYGFAGLMWWFWYQERQERQRYRDLHETILKDLPPALETLSNEVARHNQGHAQPPGE